MKRLILLTIAAVITLYGCSDDTPTSPEPEEESPLAVATVGPSGGTLQIQDFVLAVPPGAFSSSAELKLYESKDDHGFGANAASRFFRLEGLPDSYSDTLTLSIGYNGTLSGEIYIAVGTEEEVITDEFELVTGTFYSLLPAVESAGYIVTKLLPPQAGSMSSTSISPGVPNAVTGKVRLVAIKLFGDVTSAHIVIRTPLELYDHAAELLNFFEAAHDTVVALGIGYEGKQWKWPVEAAIKTSEGVTIFVHGEEKPKITLSREKVTADYLPMFQMHTIQAMMEIAIEVLDPRAFRDEDTVWWHRAVKEWAGVEFGGPQAPERPNCFYGLEAKALEGLPIGIEWYLIASCHGVGWSAVVEYLTQRYGNNIVNSIYARIKDGERTATALLEALPEPEFNWWPHFVDQYLHGNIYDAEYIKLLTGVPESLCFRIKTFEDTLWIADTDYNQLSAKLHRIIPDYALVDESATLELRIDYTQINPDYITLVVYKEKNGVLEYLGEGEQLVVKDLKTLTIEGYEILAVVINSYAEEPYTQKPKIKLTARVTKQPYNWCRISMGLLSAHFTTNNDSTFWDEEWAIEWEGEGAFSDHTFTASWTGVTDPLGGVSTGDLTVVLDPVTLDVTSFTASKIYTDAWGFESVDSVSGSNIPFYEIATLPNPYLSCRALGATACSRITSLQYVLTETATGDWEELDQYLCGNDAAIYVSFWYWEGE